MGMWYECPSVLLSGRHLSSRKTACYLGQLLPTRWPRFCKTNAFTRGSRSNLKFDSAVVFQANENMNK
jgi:hypothetical protein